MQYRPLGSTGFSVSSVSFGSWAIGGTWGTVNDDDSMKALHRACDLGTNFFDTADVYGDGRSEQLLSRLIKERSERLYIATKAGRRLSPHVKEGYTKANIESFIDRSLKNLGVETLDLLQLHCPPTDVYYQPEMFAGLEDLKKTGKLQHYGVSIERVEEGLKALEYPGVETIQLIYNVFRQRPAERLFAACREREVGVIARVPLASGMLTGKMSASTAFEDDDHRKFNRNGEAFDVGETFSGVPYELGLEVVERLKAHVPEGATMAQWALRWILMEDAISCVIPGAKNVEQVNSNLAAADMTPLAEDSMAAIREIYNESLREHVHPRW